MQQKDGLTQQQSKTILRSGLRRPNWVCRNARQNVILVRDNSDSMRGQKAAEAQAASEDLVHELAQPFNKDGFVVSIINFSKTSEVVHNMEKATALAGNMKPLSDYLYGVTSITSGLEDALQIIEAAEANVQEEISFLKPVVICFTDGCHNTGPEPYNVANQIKQKADLVAVAFGSDADESLLRKLASTPQHFYRCQNGRELRSFLAAVGATLTMTINAGVNATPALAKIR